MAAPSKQDLSLAPTQALLDELFARFDAAVFAGKHIETKLVELDTHRYAGNYTTCSGLANQVIHTINKDCDKRLKRLKEAP